MDYTNHTRSDYFPTAHLYREWLHIDRVSESHYRFGHSERHLQCIWFDPRLRPSRLSTLEGEPVCVIDPGRWNLEAGPDFRDAVLLIGEERRRICGDVEIHIASNDWTQHGHGGDCRYKNVRVHVTYYADSNPADLPKGTLHISLADGLRHTAGFHFEDIDLTAYPFHHYGAASPCSEEFKTVSIATKRALLEAAGEERLNRKAQRISLALATQTAEQIFYEQTLYALGFKHNRKPFLTLAERLPVSQLTALCKEDAYAVLLGVSHLMPAKIPPDWPDASRAFARDCWDQWFHHRNQWEERIMMADCWQYANLRPLNDPTRRMAAAAAWFSDGGDLLKKIVNLAKENPITFVKEVTNLLTSVSHPYWSYHESWRSTTKTQPVALVGQGRADAMIINVITPMLAALKVDTVFEHGLLKNLPRESNNSIIRETAYRLFGRDHPSALYKTELARQGLIQLFQDHCLCGIRSCERCTLPERIRHLDEILTRAQ